MLPQLQAMHTSISSPHKERAGGSRRAGLSPIASLSDVMGVGLPCQAQGHEPSQEACLWFSRRQGTAGPAATSSTSSSGSSSPAAAAAKQQQQPWQQQQQQQQQQQHDRDTTAAVSLAAAAVAARVSSLITDPQLTGIVCTSKLMATWRL